MPQAWIVHNDGRVESHWVDSPPPTKIQRERAGTLPSNLTAKSLSEAIALARGTREKQYDEYYRALGILSIVYVKDPDQATALVRRDG
jgi:hypothetical protein